MDRSRTPWNCQHEPHYPGHETVVMSLRYPMMTCHPPTSRCAIQEPHQTEECNEFAAPGFLTATARRVASLAGSQ